MTENASQNIPAKASTKDCTLTKLHFPQQQIVISRKSDLRGGGGGMGQNAIPCAEYSQGTSWLQNFDFALLNVLNHQEKWNEMSSIIET